MTTRKELAEALPQKLPHLMPCPFSWCDGTPGIHKAIGGWVVTCSGRCRTTVGCFTSRLQAQAAWSIRRRTAASQLKRDGELRERLEKLAEEWRNRVDGGSDAATWFMAADEIEALLKEFQ